MVDIAPVRAAQGWPGRLIRAEATALFAALLVAYGWLAGLPGALSWWWFAGLLMVPDLSMLGYLAGPRIGAAVYNMAHSALGPLVVAFGGLVAGSPVVGGLAVIWGAHVALDRALGYGLKYASGFQDTHLGRLGHPSTR